MKRDGTNDNGADSLIAINSRGEYWHRSPSKDNVSLVLIWRKMSVISTVNNLVNIFRIKTKQEIIIHSFPYIIINSKRKQQIDFNVATEQNRKKNYFIQAKYNDMYGFVAAK